MNAVPVRVNAPGIQAVSNALAAAFPLFRKVVTTRIKEFGAPWVARFEREISISLASDPTAITRAVEGYGRFSLEAMRLQQQFDKTLCYRAVSYAVSYKDAVTEVYDNLDYMLGTYLPALLLSHYLWPHHYRQLRWAHEHFFTRLQRAGARTFCDVGIGTGFYSKEALMALPGVQGWGFDISTASLRHTAALLDGWGVADRYHLCQGEVRAVAPEGFDAFIAIELLEHLEDPLAFLRSLRAVVPSRAIGLVSAAIDAPNRDHIYLYRDMEGIAQQLQAAGFSVMESANFAAYEKPSAETTVPQCGCFVIAAA